MQKRSVCAVIAALIVCFLTDVTLLAQRQNPGNSLISAAGESASEDVLKIDSQLVLIDVSVLDKNRNFIAGLARSDFRVFEDQVEQKIDIFSNEKVPVSFGLAIDTSGSMRYKLRAVIAAAKQLLTLCRPGDEVFIVDMKDSARIKFALPYTKNLTEAESALDKMHPAGGTALLDGIATACRYAQEQASHRRRALVVMSDGDERDSTLKRAQLLDIVRESDLQIYIIGFPEGLVEADGSFMEASPRKAKNLMKDIAEESGGQALFPRSLDDVSHYALKIGEELRTQYTLGYYPTRESHDGDWHSLQVKLADKNRKYAVRTRAGYFARN